MICCSLTDAREHLEYPLPGDLVGGIDHDSQEGDHVFDMGLFKEPEAASDLKGNIAPGQFHLQLHAVVMGPIEDGDLVQGNTFVPQFQDALGNELGLLDHIPLTSDDGDDAARLNGLQVLFELAVLCGYGMVG